MHASCACMCLCCIGLSQGSGPCLIQGLQEFLGQWCSGSRDFTLTLTFVEFHGDLKEVFLEGSCCHGN